MNITDRDRKILIVLVPLVVVLGYWFLLLAPKRDEAAKLDTQVTEARAARDNAKDMVDQLATSQGDFSTEYASVVRLGKAIPSSLDMPSLLVQIDAAAKGTGIRFDRIAAGERVAAPAPATPPPGQEGQQGGSGTTGSTPAAAPGGAPAQTGPGKTVEKAGNAVNEQNASSEKSGQLETSTSTSARPGGGGLPVGGGASPKAGDVAEAAGTSGVVGLDSVTLDMDFSGDFFQLADFLHRMKRFVKVNNNAIKVSGRLITIDGFELKLGGFGGRLQSTMKATVYLVPTAQGVTAGATPEGPGQGTTPASTTPGGQSQPPSSQGGATAPPAATVMP